MAHLMLDFLHDDRRPLRRERLFRDRMNPLEKYDEVEIKAPFRFERHNILRITDELRPMIQHTTGRNKALSPLHQVCIFLRFAATGCMQSSVASWINVDRSTVSRTVWRVAQSILEAHRDIFNIDVRSTKEGFLAKHGLPNIVGAIDCTHVRIVTPPRRLYPDEYINRKNYHSINVQAICDSDCIVTDVVASWPGSVHDSRILKNSDIYDRLMSGEISGTLLGDNGYGVQPICLVPFLNPLLPAEEHYNVVHKRGRGVIERTFGQVKRRFYCIGSILRIELRRVPTIINTCFILHHLAKGYGDPDFPEEDEDHIDDDDRDDFRNEEERYLRLVGQRKREEIVQYLQRH